jgi:cytochrome c oxidase cbb3-type subunit 4
MDVNTLRIAITLVSFTAFIGIVRWAWSPRNRAAFDEAARLPLMEDEGGLR